MASRWGKSVNWKILFWGAPVSLQIETSATKLKGSCSLEPKKTKSVTVSIVSPPICHEVRGPDALILIFWMVSLSQLFHSPLSLSSRGEWKSWLKAQHSETKIMASGPLTSWQIGGETVETVADFIFLAFKITADGDCSQEIQTPWN